MKPDGRRKMLLIVLSVAVGILICCLVAGYAIHQRVYRAGDGRIYRLDQEIPKAEVALVLGARVYKDGTLSRVLADRVDAGVALYKNGTVKKLIMSGDNRTEKYNEVTAMRNYAIRAGVPSNDVVRDFAGFRTYDSIYRVKELWGVNQAIIVSQKFHLQRSLFIADALDVESIGVAAVGNRYPSLTRSERREVLARILSWFDVLVGRDPYFLGPKETLDGDKQTTKVKED